MLIMLRYWLSVFFSAELLATCLFRYTSASAGSEGETHFKKSFVSALLFFQIADLDSGHKNGRARGAECPSLCSWLSPKWLALGDSF